MAAESGAAGLSRGDGYVRLRAGSPERETVTQHSCEDGVRVECGDGGVQ